jgi:hypothetical protein
MRDTPADKGARRYRCLIGARRKTPKFTSFFEAAISPDLDARSVVERELVLQLATVL